MTLALTPFPLGEGAPAHAAWHAATATELARYVVEHIEGLWPGYDYAPATIARAIRTLECDHSGKSPAELLELARALTPGSAHTDALLINLARRVLPFMSPELTVATMYSAWKGGKFGFQFLPDPADLTAEDYEAEVEELFYTLEEVHPRKFLVDHANKCDDFHEGMDRSFYDSLPDRFTVYRGCHGVTPEQCAAGVCWTTKREIAEWFARRLSHSREPVVVTARTRKEAVRLAFASEHEVVMRAWRGGRPIKVRPVKGRPPMQWTKAEAQAAA